MPQKQPKFIVPKRCNRSQLKGTMAKIFISYSKKDKHMVQQIAGPLTSLGHQLLYDDVMLAPNSSVDEALDAALKDADGVIFIFTENSVHSRNVMKEYGAAESLVADKSKFLIPIVSGSPELPDFIKRKQYLTYEDPDLISKIQSTIMASGAGIKPSPISIEKDPIPLAKGPGPTIRKERSSNPSSTKYWFLKINPETWDILDFETYFKDQSEALFGTHNLNNNQRVDYQLFFQVKKGDKAIGYAFGDKKAIECVFEITEGVHVRKEVGEVISLRFEKIISPPIPLDFFSDKIDFADKLSAEAPERIFQISPMMFNSLLASDNLSYITRDMTITNYTTEGDHKQTEDQLSFSADVMSFATVICLKKVKPPLAIGLFGKWGA
ncbi:MAG: TIR domain-containing protein, partial [Neobacillus sp.]